MVNRSEPKGLQGYQNQLQTFGVVSSWTDEVSDPQHRELELRTRHKDKPRKGSPVFEIGTKTVAADFVGRKLAKYLGP